MKVVTVTSKVTPYNIPSPKTNNFISETNSIVWKIRYFIWLEAFFGINRIYLFKNMMCSLIMSCFITLFLLVIIVTFLFHTEVFNASYIVYKNTICFEYLIISTNVLFFQKKKLNKFFENLNVFDSMLNIENNIDITVPAKEMCYWIVIGITYITIEYGILLYNSFQTNNFWYPLLYVAFVGHDIETVFIGVSLSIILRRLCIIKAHVGKIFSISTKKSSKQAMKKLEELSENAKLDINSLHHVYELLHKCCEQLNSLMGLSMLVLFFTSGLATTMLIKFIIKLAQSDVCHTPQVKTMIAYACARCFKYTLLIVFPCYLSSITANQVNEIRGMLHEAINSVDYDKIERRKVKAFYQLTRDSEFSYAVSGIIKLDMSLPLSYCSLCTTYLVIVIQFSKFLD